MIRVHVRTGMVGEAELEHHEFEAPITFEQVVERVRRPEWSGEIACALGGDLVEQLDAECPDDVDLIVAPAAMGVTTALTVLAVISAVANLVSVLTMPRPKVPGLPQEPGDIADPHNSWLGVTTTRGQGYVKPVVYGAPVVGGHVIYERIEVGGGVRGSATETLKVILALGQGPFAEIGGRVPGASAFTPVGVRANEQELEAGVDARFWGRLGELDQPSIDPSVFPGVSTTVTETGALDAQNDEVVVTFDPGDLVSRVTVIVRFPSGLYRQTSTGQITFAPGVQFAMYYRVGTSGAWVLLQSGYRALGVGELGGRSFDFSADLPQPIEDELQVRIVRTSAPGGQGVIDRAVVGQWIFEGGQDYSYPGQALLAIEMEATDGLQGQVQFEVPVKGRKVRVWDPDLGWSQPCWDRPAAPFDFMEHAPGANPAWIAIDYLLARFGAGPWLTADRLALLDFRRWSIACDDEPGPSGEEWGEAACRFDGVFGSPRPVWDNLLAITSAGRAKPFLRGRSVGVTYHYHAAHGDRGPGARMTVPEKQPTQFLNDFALRDVREEGGGGVDRPTVIDYQYQDADQRFAPATLPVQDPDSTVNQPTAFRPDAYRKEVQQLLGVARRSQVYRDGIFEHRVNRPDERLTFEAGPWMLGADIGDWIVVQSDSVRPHDSVPFTAITVTKASQAMQVVIDHQFALPAGTFDLLVRKPGGDGFDKAQIVGVEAVPDGTKLLLATAVSCEAGAPACVGKRDEITVDYEITAIGLTQKLRRSVSCVVYRPEIHDKVGKPADWEEQVGDQPRGPLTSGETAISAVRIDLDLQGRHVVSWAGPLRGRVHIRLPGADTWIVAGESEDGLLPVAWLGTFDQVEVAVGRSLGTGRWEGPPAAAAVTLTPPEFPAAAPPDIVSGNWRATGDGWEITWPDLVDQGVLYEVWRGANLATAELVYRGRETRCLDPNPPWFPAQYRLVAIAANGLRSQQALLLSPVPHWTPPGTVQLLAADMLELNKATYAGLEWIEAWVVRHTGSLLNGTAEDEFDPALGADTLLFWSVACQWHERELAVVDDLDFVVGSGEAMHRFVDTRPPSPMRPGHDLDRVLDDWHVPIDHLPTARVLGANAAAVVEARFWVGGAWTAWEPFRTGWRLASKMAVRVRLLRRSTRFEVTLEQLTVGAFG